MRLSELAAGFVTVAGSDPEVVSITEDSRRVGAGTVFVAIPGTVQDGHAFVEDAIARGAAAVVVEREPTAPATRTVPVIRVPSARRALATLAARFYGEPARALHTIGFTGTFGKTSTSEILRTLLTAAGRRPGVLGSLGARYGDFHDPGRGLTTPAPVELHSALRGLKEAGADSVIMEVTSHALRMGRVDGVTLDGGLIAAIMPGEHTDFHHSFRDYVEAKRLFLRYLAPSGVLAYDADNAPARELAAAAAAARRAGFSTEGNDAALRLADVTLDHSGAHFTIDGLRLHSPLLGRGHLRNVALALAYATADGLALARAAGVLPGLVPLRRRMESYTAAGRVVLDDTAAHPESLRAAFEVAAMLAARKNAGRTIAVYAIRGSRGTQINAQNAGELSALGTQYGLDGLIVSAAADTVGPNDRATPDEIDAARRTLRGEGCRFEWTDNLADAVAAAKSATRAGDLIVLLGAQGMNEGKRLLLA